MWDNSVSIQRGIPINKKGQSGRVDSAAFRDTNFAKQLLGGCEQHGSITDDNFVLRTHIAYPHGSAIAKLDLETERVESELEVKTLISYPHIRSIENPFARISAMKRMHRSKVCSYNPDRVLPVFGTLQQTILVYAATSNAAWGMFYAEFYRFVNFFCMHSTLLLIEPLGFKDVYLDKHCVFPNHLDDSNSCPLVAASLDAIVVFITFIAENTVCLLQPVGLQHMLPATDTFLPVLERTLGIVKANACRFLKKVPITGRAKTHIAWKHSIELLETCLVCLRFACMFKDLLVHFVTKRREDIHFSQEDIDDAKSKHPIGYGYKLRGAELARSLITRKQGGFVPFDFYKFVNIFARFTKVDFIDYLPCFRRHQLFIQTNTENKITFIHSNSSFARSKFDPTAYFSCIYRSFGNKHAETIKKFTMRMKQEAFEYSSGTQIVSSVLDENIQPRDYPGILILFARNDQMVAAGERPTQDSFYNDLFSKGRDEKTLWKHWLHMAKASFLEFNAKWTICEEIDFGSIRHDLSIERADKSTKEKLRKVYVLAARAGRACRRGRATARLVRLVKTKYHLVEMMKRSRISKEAAEKGKRMQNNRRVEIGLTRVMQTQAKEKSDYKMRMLEMDTVLHDLARRLEYFLVVNLHRDDFLRSQMRADGFVSVDVFLSFPSLQHIFSFFKCATIESARNVVLMATKLSHFVQVAEFQPVTFHALVRGVK